MVKRIRMPQAKPGELKIAWGKERGNNPELQFCWGDGASRRDANLLMMYMGSERPRMDYSVNPPKLTYDNGLIKELEARGYDISTLKFSIQKKAEPT